MVGCADPWAGVGVARRCGDGYIWWSVERKGHPVSVVKINVLSVPAERRDVLEQRFAARAGEVDSTPGFESFQLLRPTDESDRYFVVTQWETEQAFTDWMESRAFQRGHAGGGDGDAGGGDGNGAGHDDRPDDAAPRPVASQAELLSFEVVEESHAG